MEDITKTGPVGLKGLKGVDRVPGISDEAYNRILNEFLPKSKEQIRFEGALGMGEAYEFDSQNDIGSSNYDKGIYTEEELLNIEDTRAKEQSAWSKWANSGVKMLGTFGTTFIDGTLGTLVGIGTGITNVIDDDENTTFISGMWDNAVTNMKVGSQIFGNNSLYWYRLLKLWGIYENIIYRFCYGEYLSYLPSSKDMVKPVGDIILNRLEYYKKYMDGEAFNLICNIFPIKYKHDDLNKNVDVGFSKLRILDKKKEVIVAESPVEGRVQFCKEQFTEEKAFLDKLFSIDRIISNKNLQEAIGLRTFLSTEEVMELLDLNYSDEELYSIIANSLNVHKLKYFNDAVD